MKLLVTYGKDIVSVPTCSGASHVEVGGSDDRNENLFMIIKVLLMNMHFGVSSPGCYTLNVHQNIYYEVIRHGMARHNDGRENLDMPHSDYNNSEQYYPEDDAKDVSIYTKNYHSDQEVVEKIKSNSLKILTIFMRNLPDFFMEQPILKLVIPSQLCGMNTEEFTRDCHYIPHSLYSNPVMHLLGDRQATNIMLLQIFEIISSIVEADYLSHHKHVSFGMLTKMKNKCRAQLQSTTDMGINLVLAMLNEPSVEIKSEIIAALSTFQEVLHKRLEHPRSKGPADEMDLSKNIQLSKVAQHTESLYTLFVLELYLSKSSNVKNILDALSQSSSRTLWQHVAPALKRNLVVYFIIPVFATCFDIQHDFTREFALFLEAIFEAGFSEYFLPKINYVKEILLVHIDTCRNRWKNIESFQFSLTILMSFIDSMLKYHSFSMTDLLEPICSFYVEDILKCKELHAVHHLVAKFLSRVLHIQRTLIPIKSATRLHRSFSFSDADLLHMPEKPKLDHDDVSQEQTLVGSQRNNKRIYLQIDKVVKRLYSELFTFATNQHLTDQFEQEFITVFTSIPSTLIYNLNVELEKETHANIEDCLMTIFNKMNHKKNKLMLVDGILSNQHMAMLELRKKMWTNLFALHLEKSLSVEIVFTNYNIIYGLRDFKKILNDRYIEKIFHQTVSSMRSKNRKLISNCLKIFGYILGFYSFGILNWIVEAEVPNVFYEEMQGEGTKNEPLPCIHFLRLTYGKYLTHKYSKFNVISMECLEMIVDRHQDHKHSISRSLIQLVDSLADKVFDKLVNTESFKLKTRCLEFLITKDRLAVLSAVCMAGLLQFTQRLLAQTLESAKTSLDEEELRQKQSMEAKSYEYFFAIEGFLFSEKATVAKDPQVVAELESCIESLLKRALCDFSVGSNSSVEPKLYYFLFPEKKGTEAAGKSERSLEPYFRLTHHPHATVSKERLLQFITELETVQEQEKLRELSAGTKSLAREVKSYLEGKSDLG